jgi:hypothetical protein
MSVAKFALKVLSSKLQTCQSSGYLSYRAPDRIQWTSEQKRLKSAGHSILFMTRSNLLERYLKAAPSTFAIRNKSCNLS